MASSNRYAAALRPASLLKFPAGSDCNSPSYWDGDIFHQFMSWGHPHHSFGPDPFLLPPAVPVTFSNSVSGGRWIESVRREEDGTVYGWYHNEPAGLCPGTDLTAPKIGALRTRDGDFWEDLGVVLEARPGPLRCDAKNGYFAGGHGDFCVNLDHEKRYAYFFYGNYYGDLSEQGVSVARMAWSDRDAPVGRVSKWHGGEWSEPGAGGNLTPIFGATTPWEGADCEAFWGPSVHWNTALETWVMLLNRAKGAGWVQEGIYVCFSDDLSDPESWSAPEKILDGGAWYPQVIGTDSGQKQTDKIAGGTARFYMSGTSEYEIVFRRA